MQLLLIRVRSRSNSAHCIFVRRCYVAVCSCYVAICMMFKLPKRKLYEYGCRLLPHNNARKLPMRLVAVSVWIAVKLHLACSDRECSLTLCWSARAGSCSFDLRLHSSAE